MFTRDAVTESNVALSDEPDSFNAETKDGANVGDVAAVCTIWKREVALAIWAALIIKTISRFVRRRRIISPPIDLIDTLSASTPIVLATQIIRIACTPVLFLTSAASRPLNATLRAT